MAGITSLFVSKKHWLFDLIPNRHRKLTSFLISFFHCACIVRNDLTTKSAILVKRNLSTITSIISDPLFRISETIRSTKWYHNMLVSGSFSLQWLESYDSVPISNKYWNAKKLEMQFNLKFWMSKLVIRSEFLLRAIRIIIAGIRMAIIIFKKHFSTKTFYNRTVLFQSHFGSLSYW